MRMLSSELIELEKLYDEFFRIFPKGLRDAINIFIDDSREEVIFPLINCDPTQISSQFIESRDKLYIYLNTLDSSLKEFEKNVDRVLVEKINLYEMKIFEKISDFLIEHEYILKRNIDPVIYGIALVLDFGNWVRNEYIKDSKFLNKISIIPEYTTLNGYYLHLLLCTSTILKFISSMFRKSKNIENIEYAYENIWTILIWLETYTEKLESSLDTLNILVDDIRLKKIEDSRIKARSVAKGE